MLEANIRKNIVNRKEIELIAKGIQDNNPGMAYQSAMEYAEKNVINKKKKPDYIIYYANKLFI